MRNHILAVGLMFTVAISGCGQTYNSAGANSPIPFLGNQSEVLNEGEVVFEQMLPISINSQGIGGASAPLRSASIDPAPPAHGPVEILEFNPTVNLTIVDGRFEGVTRLCAKYGPIPYDVQRIEIRAFLRHADGLLTPGGSVVPVQMGHINREEDFPSELVCDLNRMHPHVVDSWDRVCGIIYGNDTFIKECYDLRIIGDMVNGAEEISGEIVFQFVIYRSQYGDPVNLVTNGGFEMPELGPGPDWGLFEAIPGWFAENIPFNAPIEIDRDGIGDNPWPLEGNQALKLDVFAPEGGFQSTNSCITQILNTEAERTYKLEYLVSTCEEDGDVRREDTHESFGHEVYWNGVKLNFEDAIIIEIPGTHWKKVKFTGLPSDESHARLSFKGSGIADMQGATIDEVCVHQEIDCQYDK